MEELIIKKKKRRNYSIIVILLLFFLLYFVLEDVGIYIQKERKVLANEPYNITKEVKIEKQTEIPICENRSFKYSTLGGNVDSVDNSVRPNLVLNNLENKWGEYLVNFSYIDEERFTYDTYGGQNLVKNIESGKLSWEDGDFFSITYVIMMPPGEGVLIDDFTKKDDNEKNYWAIANIIEPKFEYCYNKIEKYDVIENKTFTEYKKIEKSAKVKEYVKIFDILKIESFGEWIIIVMMCFLIILLLKRIKDRFREKRIIEKEINMY